MLRWVLTYMLFIIAIQAFAGGNDTTRLYFDLDIDSLSYNSKSKLRDFIRKNEINKYKSVIIIGYTDYLGTEDYNIVLSKERARNVAYYLLENNVQEENITVCMGRGKIERKGITGSQGYPTDRRVDVVVVDKPRKLTTKDTARKKPVPQGDPKDMTVVMKPGQKRPPIPDDMKNIPLYRAQPKADTPKKPGTTYKITDSGNIYVVMRPGGDKSGIPEEMRNMPASKPDPYKSKNEIDLSKVNAGETFVLKNIYFFPQSHTVRDESITEMEKLANALKKYTTLKIQIEGHICCVVDFPDAFDVDAQDNHLSVNRAKYIYEYLLSKGISRDRLRYAGFGRLRPVIENEKSETDANQNRRVEIRILEK